MSGGARPRWLAAAPAIFLLLWSAGFPIAKLGLLYTGPLTFLALRYVILVAILAPAALAIRAPMPRGRALADVALTGFLIQVFYFGLAYYALKKGMSAGGLAIIVCLQPILVGLIAPRLVGEPVGRARWVGLVLGLAGAATVILARSSISAESPLAVAAAVGALIGMTGGTLFEKARGVSHHPVTANLVQYAVGAACTLPIAWASEGLVVQWTPELGWVMAYLIIGNSLVSMTLLLAMIRAGEVARVSALFYLVPPLSALFAWPILGEAMPPLAWAGMAVAAAGVAVASRPRPRPVLAEGDAVL